MFSNHPEACSPTKQKHIVHQASRSMFSNHPQQVDLAKNTHPPPLFFIKKTTTPPSTIKHIDQSINVVVLNKKISYNWKTSKNHCVESAAVLKEKCENFEKIYKIKTFKHPLKMDHHHLLRACWRPPSRRACWRPPSRRAWRTLKNHIFRKVFKKTKVKPHHHQHEQARLSMLEFEGINFFNQN